MGKCFVRFAILSMIAIISSNCAIFIGVKHHNGEQSAYGLRFDVSGTLIGVRLDMWRGTLEFFHNRKPLGK